MDGNQVITVLRLMQPKPNGLCSARLRTENKQQFFCTNWEGHIGMHSSFDRHGGATLWKTSS